MVGGLKPGPPAPTLNPALSSANDAPKFSRFDTVLACDGHADGRTTTACGALARRVPPATRGRKTLCAVYRHLYLFFNSMKLNSTGNYDAGVNTSK